MRGSPTIERGQRKTVARIFTSVAQLSERAAASRAVLFVTVTTAALCIIVGSPLFGWFGVVRVSAVLWPILAAGYLVLRPWRWVEAEWSRAAAWGPSKGAITAASAVVGLVLFWLVYSRFQAGGIDAVDFTVYFDRPLYQTSRGRIFFVESTDDPQFAYLTHLAVHAYWILLPLAMLYWLYATPMWLLALSVLAVTVGAIYLFRILRRCGAGGALAAAGALAFVLNGNTARALNYGFHAEILYALFVPMALDAGLRRARLPFVGAVIACVLVKEDAVFPLIGVCAALALTIGSSLTRGERALYLGMPPALALGQPWCVLSAAGASVIPGPAGDVLVFLVQPRRDAARGAAKHALAAATPAGRCANFGVLPTRVEPSCLPAACRVAMDRRASAGGPRLWRL
jgi:hypothetical protein